MPAKRRTMKKNTTAEQEIPHPGDVPEIATPKVHWVEDRLHATQGPHGKGLDPGPYPTYNGGVAMAADSRPVLHVNRALAEVLDAGIASLHEQLQSANYSIQRLQDNAIRMDQLNWRYRGFLGNIVSTIAAPADLGQAPIYGLEDVVAAAQKILIDTERG